MRLTYVLLLAAAALLANTNALATEGDAGKRFLRSHKNHKKTASAAAAAEEERGILDFLKNVDDLPMFERMKLQPTYKNHIFESWRTGMGTVDEAKAFMASQGLSLKEIDEWVELWLKHIAAKRAAK